MCEVTNWVFIYVRLEIKLSPEKKCPVRMGRWSEERYKNFSLGCLILVWNTAVYYHCYGFGGDLPSVFYNETSLYMLQASPVLAQRLNSAWYMLTYLCSAKIRLTTSLLLTIGIYKKDMIWRFPWLLYTVLEFVQVCILVIWSWLIIFICLEMPTNIYMMTVLITLLAGLRMFIWEVLCWGILNDIVQDITVISTRQRRYVVITFENVPQENSSTNTEQNEEITIVIRIEPEDDGYEAGDEDSDHHN
ncbi:hypothetical protein L9F63_012449 [Diploptera punctata]|uniref:Uncharacterized protein n=1 Tax=Diploptera punctata TaxID=6984 RepID=A0AAD8ADT8_DIPPU|nr:hypothetical protein L9F63_012449 [Diploptera punctata]